MSSLIVFLHHLQYEIEDDANPTEGQRIGFVFADKKIELSSCLFPVGFKKEPSS